ncbi:hypothetical protein R1flu_020412 [Riccia fluitans]|uniref:Uncharacterized protein n=1 Tax=Riccia fluitans TaxID=41844 RepID=A0ABD1ZPY2_9MARC
METWGLGGLFVVDWSRTYEDLVEELAGHLKAAVPKYEYRGKPKAWTLDVWREVYNLPKASPGSYIMKGKMLNAILALVKLEHFQHNLLAFYHYAWVAINDPTAPIPDWGDAVEKTVSKQIRVLGVCNEATCLGPYLAHLYTHFHEMDAEEKEDSKKWKALIQTVSDSDTETEDEKEPKEEIPRIVYGGEASETVEGDGEEPDQAAHGGAKEELRIG